MRYRFGNIDVDLDTFELRRDGRAIPVRKTTFNVLCYLITHRNRVVTKQDLLDNLWSDTHVTDSAIAWYICNLRKILGQKRSDRAPVETVHGRGYQFKSEVQVVDEDAISSATADLRPTAEIEELFVGRQEVMVYLTHAFNNAVGGRGSILILRGEAGIGKTRCAAEFSRDVISRGFGVWMGRCPETASQPPFWPWIQILRSARAEQPDASTIQAEASHLLSKLVPHDRKDRPRHEDSLHGTTDKFWLYDHLLNFLRASCISKPRILIIDDIQWADDASLEFLAFVAPEAAGMKLLLIVTLRDFEEMGARSGHLNRLLRYTKHIPLGGLSEDNVDQYILQSGLFERSDELNRAFYQKTGGNPLFLRETLRWLQWTHAQGKQELTAAAIRQLNVPDTVEKLLRYRLDSLDDETKLVIDIASVVGRSFDIGLISHSLPAETQTVVSALDRAMAAGIIVKDSTTRFRFSHDLMCEVAYERIPSTTRSDYHNRIAKTLLTRADREENIGQAAFHLHQALPLSDLDETINACQKAAELSERVYAHGDAAVYYRWTLEAMSLSRKTDPILRTKILVSLGRQARISGDAESSKQAITQALETARTYRLYDIISDIASIGRATFLSAHIERPAVLEALGEALKHVPDEDRPLRIRLLSQLALTPPFSTDIERCKHTSRQAVELAESQGDKQLMRVALNAALCSFTGPDDIDALLKTADQILDLHSEGEWTLTRIEALVARILAFLHQGDIKQAKASIEAFGATMTRIHRVEGQWFYHRLLAQFTLDEGRFDDAARKFDELARRAKRMGMYYFEIFQRIQLAYIMRARGATVEQVRELYVNTIGRFRNPFTHAEIIGLIIETGFPELVREAYSKVIALGLRRVPRNAMWLNTLCNMALAAVVFSDRRTIAELYEHLAPYAGFNTPDGILLYDGSVSHYLGILASKRDRETEAVRHFEQAIESNRRMGLRPQLLRTQVVFAEWLTSTSEKKHKNRLKELRAEAHDSAREMKMALLLKRIEALTND
ncbi:MAG: AAA family ATPase [Deltaproteobacteria bacterium]|nr:AAA family ATPase [Deltaproteobacteria bacterium]